jgi:CopA family copper-resistance protein
VAETFDVIVEPSGQDAYTIFAQDMGRTGHARGTLAVRLGLEAPLPAADPRPILTMDDMGHGGMGHSGHDMSATKGMEGGCGASMGMKGMEGGCGANMAGMDHAVAHRAIPRAKRIIRSSTCSASAVSPKLDDPGIGLRGNGRTVLTYGAMKSLFEDPDGREPSREIELHLDRPTWRSSPGRSTGRNSWTPNRCVLNYGERMRIVLVNDTMMTHPIHLHGMWSDVEDEHGQFQLRKHTVDMPPGTKRSYRVRADALGRWAFHCHLLYHMEAGMMREVKVEE